MTKQDITDYISKYGRLETTDSIVSMINYFCNKAIQNYIEASGKQEEVLNVERKT